jgi:hypothetical protein
VNSDHSRKFELECMRLASGCIQLGDGLGTELESEILRLAGEHSTQQWPEARRRLELECLRMAADCMQLVGTIQNFKLQRHFLKLARQLTAVAEAAPPPICQATI